MKQAEAQASKMATSCTYARASGEESPKDDVTPTKEIELDAATARPIEAKKPRIVWNSWNGAFYRVVNTVTVRTFQERQRNDRNLDKYLHRLETPRLLKRSLLVP
jgi:hypothetical protein